MEINKNTKDMLKFYEIKPVPPYVRVGDLINILNNLGDKWKTQLLDFIDYELYLFNEKCLNKESCCLECDNLFNCKDNCYTRTFDCCDCKRNNF